jgi:hypothetical protein
MPTSGSFPQLAIRVSRSARFGEVVSTCPGLKGEDHERLLAYCMVYVLLIFGAEGLQQIGVWKQALLQLDSEWPGISSGIVNRQLQFHVAETVHMLHSLINNGRAGACGSRRSPFSATVFRDQRQVW